MECNESTGCKSVRDFYRPMNSPMRRDFYCPVRDEITKLFNGGFAIMNGIMRNRICEKEEGVGHVI